MGWLRGPPEATRGRSLAVKREKKVSWEVWASAEPDFLALAPHSMNKDPAPSSSQQAIGLFVAIAICFAAAGLGGLVTTPVDCRR